MRLGTFAAILLVAGSVVFQGVVLAPLRTADGPSRRVARKASPFANRWALGAAIALVVFALWRLIIQVSAFAIPGEPAGPVIKALLMQTAWGRGWWFQLVATAIVFAVFARPRHPRDRAWWLRAGSAALLALTPAFAGHAGAASSARTLSVITDWLHVAAAGSWLGTMFVLVAAGLPAVARFGGGRADIMAAMIRKFSPVALISAGVLVGTGVISAWLRLSTFGDLWRSGYGILLSVKILLAALMAGAGAYNWKRMTPRLTDESALPAARRSIATEVAVGVLILLVTAILVATPFPEEALQLVE